MILSLLTEAKPGQCKTDGLFRSLVSTYVYTRENKEPKASSYSMYALSLRRKMISGIRILSLHEVTYPQFQGSQTSAVNIM